MPTHNKHRRPDLRLRAAALLALAALVAAFAFATPRDAHAQSDTYVDLVITNDYGDSRLEGGLGEDQNVIFYVHNLGTAEARGVTVSFVLDKLQATYGTGVQPPSDVKDITKGGGQESFTWVVGTIPAGSTSRNVHAMATVRNSTEPVPQSSPYYRIGSIRAEVSAQTFEPLALRNNNVRTVYAYSNDTSGLSLHMVDGRLGLSLSVDNLRPTSTIANVDFGLTARTYSPGRRAYRDFSGVIADIEISVELSEGLKFKDSWTPPDGFATSSSQLATWTPQDVTGDLTDTAIDSVFRQIAIEAALSGDSLDAIPLERRCITARVTDSIPPPEPGYVLGSLKQCLGDDPTVLFEEGELDLFTLYPCVGVSPIAYPCRDENDDSTVDNGLELVAGADITLQFAPRTRGVGRGDDGNTLYLRPESVVIQVKDPEGREVNSSNITEWWIPYGQGVAPTLDNSLLTSSDWTHFVWRIASEQLPTGGHVYYGPNANRAAFYVNTNDKAQHPPGGLTAMSNAVKVAIPTYYRFTALGTYIIDFTSENTHNNGTATTTDDVDYSATGRYTFHVGPVAELEVRDGGERPDLGTDQRAFTIVAVNNGPDDASAAEVTVTGLNAATCTGTATKGSLAFASSECTWTIGELTTEEVSQTQNGRDGEILTITTTAAVDTEITAEIENTLDYQVCIDSSGNDVDLTSPSSTACTNASSTNTWHTTEYYDYIDDNSTTTIKAKDGTGVDLPSLQSAQEDTASIIVTWNAIDEVNGRGVTHYEVQRQTNPWVTVATTSLDTYVDTDVEAGDTFQYRIRAVNDWDHKGPWSQPMTGTVEIPPPGQPTLSATPLSNSEILLTWNTPSGATVGRYELEVCEVLADCQSDEALWTSLGGANLSANSHEHTGLQAGDERHYRVRAWNTDSPEESGDWSATVNATTPTGPTVEYRDRVVTRTETETVTVEVPEAAFAYFPSGRVSRAVAENSAPGSPVGAPVVVVKNSGNNVVYSLEGADAALFSVERDSGQILVGQGAVLDFESDRTSYSVEVVAEPSRGSKVRATVDIDVVDVAESASVTITPDGQPEVGVELTATLTHGGGQPVDPAWLWQRSRSGGLWLNIAGATSTAYTPTEQDAGMRLRVIATYGEPDGSGEGVAGAVTQALAGEPATSPVASYDADGDGRIDVEEVIAAIGDYFAGTLDLDGVMEVIAVYYAG